jgi:hypothetical protein
MQDIQLEDLDEVTGGSEGGNLCRDLYAGVGAFVGGALTSESFGWGAIPGGLIGGAVGRAVCPP